jgi:hypothetical protein
MEQEMTQILLDILSAEDTVIIRTSCAEPVLENKPKEKISLILT